jgi:hypothetical protein
MAADGGTQVRAAGLRFLHDWVTLDGGGQGHTDAGWDALDTVPLLSDPTLAPFEWGQVGCRAPSVSRGSQALWIGPPGASASGTDSSMDSGAHQGARASRARDRLYRIAALTLRRRPAPRLMHTSCVMSGGRWPVNSGTVNVFTRRDTRISTTSARTYVNRDTGAIVVIDGARSGRPTGDDHRTPRLDPGRMGPAQAGLPTSPPVGSSGPRAVGSGARGRHETTRGAPGMILTTACRNRHRARPRVTRATGHFSQLGASRGSVAPPFVLGPWP